MKDNKIKKIIEEAIDDALLKLKEQDDYGSSSDTLGGIYGNYLDSMGPYGGGDTGGSKSDLLNILPFGFIPRVGKTLMWGVENMTQRVFSLLKTIFSYATKAFLPFFSAINDYKKISSDEKQNLRKIDQKYAKVLEENLAVLYDLDAWGIVFLLDPSLGLGWRLVEKVPGTVMSMADALTGGTASQLMKDYANRTETRPSDEGQGNSVRSFFSQIGLTDFGLAEAIEPNKEYQEVKLADFLKGFLNSPEYKKGVVSAGIAPKIKTFATNSILNRVRKVLSAKSLEELSANVPELAPIIKQTIEQIAKPQQIAEQNQQAPQQPKITQNVQLLSVQELQQAKLALLNKIKQDFKQNAIDNLKRDSASNPALANSVNGIIKQIETLK